MTSNTVRYQSDTSFMFQNYLFDIETQIGKWDGDLNKYNHPNILSNNWNREINNLHSVEKYNGYFDLRSMANQINNTFGSSITKNSANASINLKHARALIDYPYPWSSLRSGRKLLNKSKESSYTLDLPNFVKNYGDSSINKLDNTSRKVINCAHVNSQRERFRTEIKDLIISELNIPNRTLDYYLTELGIYSGIMNEINYPPNGCSLERQDKFTIFYGTQQFKLFKYYDRFSMLDSGKRIREDHVTRLHPFIKDNNLRENNTTEEEIKLGPLDIVTEEGRIYGPLGQNPLNNRRTDVGIKEDSIRLWQGYPGALRVKNSNNRPTLQSNKDYFLIDKL